jgi:hypothetical protein
MFLDFKRPRPIVFHRVSQAVQRTNPRIPAPGKNQFSRATRADQLVVNDVRRHSHQCQVFSPLPDHFMPGGEGTSE